MASATALNFLLTQEVSLRRNRVLLRSGHTFPPRINTRFS
ncbi:hypothetical protein CBM2626_A230052 [Cupriavidus taiwanensis]|nr:hypothetical protein CBM2626_A230052 [Cupriavidus taiwanensis]